MLTERTLELDFIVKTVKYPCIVYRRLWKSCRCGRSISKVHKTCRSVFTSNSGRYTKNYGTINICRQEIPDSHEIEHR